MGTKGHEYQLTTIDFEDLNQSGDINSRGPRFQEAVRKLGGALTEIGFFALVNHGIPTELIQSCYQNSAEFFALPETQKKQYEDEAIKGQRGFISFGREHARDSQRPDLKEFWHVGRETYQEGWPQTNFANNVWPKQVPAFKNHMVTFYDALDHCAQKLLEATALYLGEDASLFRDAAINGDSILRVIHYPPVSQASPKGSVRAAAHEDINFITLLCESTASGLELMDQDGVWHPVFTQAGAIVVDAGDMLQNITNGFYKSTTHRVINPEENDGSARFSMPFFCHPRGEVDLSPLQSCLAKTGSTQKYPNISARDFLEQRLKELGL